MRACPHDELVLLHGRSLASLELRREEVGEAEPALVVEAVDPGVGTRRQLAVLRADVVGLAKVVPGDNLDERDLVAVRDHVFPAGDPEVLVAVEDEVLVERVRAEVREEPRCDGGHVRLRAALDVR